MTTIICSECGICFGMPDHYCHARREDHANFYCPNGHQQHFFRNGECKDQQIARLTEELTKLRSAGGTKELNAYQRGYHAGKKKRQQLALPAPRAKVSA